MELTEAIRGGGSIISTYYPTLFAHLDNDDNYNLFFFEVKTRKANTHSWCPHRLLRIRLHLDGQAAWMVLVTGADDSLVNTH